MAIDLVFKVPLLQGNSSGIQKGALHFCTQVPKNFFYFENHYCIFCNTRQLLIYVESSLIGRKSSLRLTRALWLVKNRHFCLKLTGGLWLVNLWQCRQAKRWRKTSIELKSQKNILPKHFFIFRLNFSRAVAPWRRDQLPSISNIFKSKSNIKNRILYPVWSTSSQMLTFNF